VPARRDLALQVGAEKVAWGGVADPAAGAVKVLITVGGPEL
jgi:hypothetical protein